MVVHKKIVGNLAEQRACQFLQAQGLKLITQNFRTIHGEIDLIMREGDEIVFIEVRSRAKNDYGTPIESINKNKQKKVIKTSLIFLQQRNWLDKVNCRFDVIGVNQDHLEWIQDAFTADIL
jgi:putative endonuclease